ncbi:PH domain-containing protein [Lentibacillus sp. N15]|uniref:PH domain-containing protein n=1 Tax=Lentibacillus songyuanensis TaxID=3136161 RepID=UPI0031BAD6F3
MYTTTQPENQISTDAIKVWRISNIIQDVIALIVLIGLLWTGIHFAWFHWIIVILWILLGLTPVDVIWSIGIQPVLLHKYWRYGITEEFVQLKHGIFEQKYTVIPMTKIQYVEATQGPLLKKYGLYTIKIGTMRSSHEIPALPEAEAFVLRENIAERAKLKEAE